MVDPMETELFRLHPVLRWGRFILAFFFSLWGLGRIFFFLAEAAVMMGRHVDDPGAAVGAAMATAAVLVPQALIWIGGILFLGIAALLVTPVYKATKQDY
jgi:hypothetical protein